MMPAHTTHAAACKATFTHASDNHCQFCCRSDPVWLKLASALAYSKVSHMIASLPKDSASLAAAMLV